MTASTMTAATERHTAHDRDDDTIKSGGKADDATTTAEGRVDDARHEAEHAFATVRAAAGDIGDQVPRLVRSVRSGATDGARSIGALPEPTQRLLGVFSLGLGLGLLVAGAPRLVVGGALLPALGVVASALGRETGSNRSVA